MNDLSTMKRASQLLLGFCFFVFSSVSVSSELVKAPKGWEDKRSGESRIATNGNATVIITPWQYLKDVPANQWLSAIEKMPPTGGEFISSEGVKPETVPGAFSVMRKARFGSENGISVLYLCPGVSGHARLMILNVKDGGFFDTVKGALFGEKVCKKEPKGAEDTTEKSKSESKPSLKVSPKSSSSSKQNKLPSQPWVGISDEELKSLNDNIPAHNRPIAATMYSTQSLVGFPAMLIFKVHMALEFEGGIELACTAWDPTSDIMARSLVNEKDCSLSEGEETTRILSFNPGERIDLAFGTINAFGIDYGDSAASSINGGDLTFNLNGDVVLGTWQANTMSTENVRALATSVRRNGVVGRYYLNGNTISIATTDGEVIHGFIGYSKREGRIGAVYINGKHYWDRSK